MKKLLSVLLMLLCTSLIAAPSKKLWDVWSPYQASSNKTIDHEQYQDFLNKYVYKTKTGVNYVRYSKVTKTDKTALEAYLKTMSQIPIAKYSRTEQLAYWINIYNALTIDTVLKHYPVKSIRDIKLGGWFSAGPWDAKLISIDDKQVSLNDIEHRIIRPIWNDPRTHYALNCASYSCPNLQQKAYAGKTINAMLTSDAKQYINSKRGVDIENGKLYVSSIYDWYQVDFGGNAPSVIKHLQQYASPKLKQQLQQYHDISGYRYNWQLNGN